MGECNLVNPDGSDLLRKRKAEIVSDDCNVANIPLADIDPSATGHPYANISKCKAL